VRGLDVDARTALVSPANVDWYTQAKVETETSIVEPLRQEPRLGLELSFGPGPVTERVIAYQRKSISGGDTLETFPLDLPETSFETEAIWFSPTAVSSPSLEEMPKLLSSLHAAEHSLIALLPLWAMCDRWDIGGLSTNIHRQTGLPTIFVYDGHAGGVGITERGFERFEGWVEDTAKMLAGCPCAVGCPSCVQSPKCGNLNDYLDKHGALTLLQRLLAS
jgi:DEAD/DEAH box helicase domain-containing protein